MRLLLRVGTVAELEVRDWRVVRAEGDLAQLYKTLVEIALDEAREMSDYQRRVVLIKELEDFGFVVVKEEWPPFGEVPPGTIP